jgi:hypothetical protein
MQQIPPQRENPIGTFQNNLRAQNQKLTGNKAGFYNPRNNPKKKINI